jgi:cyclopropane-fatty-acyl-phospholipid synthase
MTSGKDVAGLTATLLAGAGLELPVRLRAWDGSEAGPTDAPVLVLRSPRALQRILWRPGELGLARAYVSGDLDVEGDLTDGLRRVRATLRQAPPRPPPAGRTRPGRDPHRGPARAPRPASRPADLRAPGPRPPAQPGPGPGRDRRSL